MKREELKDKKILVAGMGRSGKAAVDALLSVGADVYAYDSHTEEELGYTPDEKVTKYFGIEPELDGIDMVIVSPGIPMDNSLIKEALDREIEVIGELELAYILCVGSFIGITGTNGKTTTTTLVGEIFKRKYEHTYVVGNIGVAVVSKALRAEEDAWMITETSSFQLETAKTFRPVVSAILNLTPDHLNRHGTMEEYGRCKANIFRNQDVNDYAVANYDDKASYDLFKDCRAEVIPFSRREVLGKGAFLKDGNLVVIDGEEKVICASDELKIIGDHNIENALAAIAICYWAGIDTDTIRAGLIAFGGVEHRIEYVDEIDGVKYYNDSKGTNTDATIIALRALKENILLLAGGDAKKQDFTPLAEELEGRVKHVLLYGRDAGDIKRALDEKGFTDYSIYGDLKEATEAARDMAESGDQVLLSPACASWDYYKNFEVRGEHFKEIVRGF